MVWATFFRIPIDFNMISRLPKPLPNPLEMAKEECLGGNCNITAVDEKNDKHVKVLVNRKRVAAQPMPSAGADMPVKRL